MELVSTPFPSPIPTWLHKIHKTLVKSRFEAQPAESLLASSLLGACLLGSALGGSTGSRSSLAVGRYTLIHSEGDTSRLRHRWRQGGILYHTSRTFGLRPFMISSKDSLRPRRR